MIRTVNSGAALIRYELLQTNRRDMSLKVTKDDVRLFAPIRARLRSCDDFVIQQANWITQTHKRLVEYDRRYALEHPLESGAELMLGGQLMKLDVAQSPKASVEQSGETLVVRAPSLEREKLRKTLVEYFKKRALAEFQSSVASYAPIVGRAPKSVKLREQRTRWGSCSNEGNINLNWKLVMAPRPALDYVVVHELCHLYELNHSQAFWKRVKSVMPDCEYWRKWLKDNARALGF